MSSIIGQSIGFDGSVTYHIQDPSGCVHFLHESILAQYLYPEILAQEEEEVVSTLNPGAPLFIPRHARILVPVPVDPIPVTARRIDITTLLPNLAPVAPVAEPVSVAPVAPVINLELFPRALRNLVQTNTGGHNPVNSLPVYTPEIASQASELLRIIMKEGNEERALSFLNGEFSKVFTMLLKFRASEQLDNAILPFALFHFANFRFKDTFGDAASRWVHFCWLFRANSMTFP
jgi:hypothetical protein